MEIREFIDSDGKPINSEILDMNRQYETLRDALQLADQKEREEAKGNKNETEQKEISEKAATRKKLLEKLEESMSPTKLQSDSKNVIFFLILFTNTIYIITNDIIF